MTAREVYNRAPPNVRTLIPLSQDENGTQDFDDLMKSGTTMKVSLTPDRLKTFEVRMPNGLFITSVVRR